MWSPDSRSAGVATTNPNRDDAELSITTPAHRNADLSIATTGTISWTVRDEDIGDPAYVHIYMASQRPYHGKSRYDDGSSFAYRVLPRA